MTVAKLKKLLEKLPDDAKVLVPASDHSYRDAGGAAATALFDRDGGWTEDHGEEATPEAEYGNRVPVLVII